MKLNSKVFNLIDVVQLSYGKLEEYLYRFIDARYNAEISLNDLDEFDEEYELLTDIIICANENINIFVMAMRLQEDIVIKEVETEEGYYCCVCLN